jgi:Domain of unknown function (DUF4258)
MSATLARIQVLAGERVVRISDHAYEELRNDDIDFDDVMVGLANAQVVEDYPDYALGPCVLVLQRDRDDRPIHVVWGIPKGRQVPAVLVTAYRPSLSLWSDDFLERKKS